MMAAPAPLSPAAANALSAFLRGVECRALVLAQLQTGDSDVAERAVAVAMRAFTGNASQLQMADWPGHFWGLLCSTPQLLAPSSGGHWPEAVGHLQVLAPAERLALLLRIVAGLDEDAASAVLGVHADAYRQALAGACPVDAHGQPDAAGWRALAEQVQAQVRDLSARHLQQLEQLRETAISGELPQRPAPKPAPVVDTPRRAPARKRAPSAPWRLRTWLLLCLPLLLLAVVLAWWWRSHLPTQPATDGNGLADSGPVQVEPLADESTPATPAPDHNAASDAAMLADPDLAIARNVDLNAWYAAGGPLPVDESQPQPTRPEPAGAALETVDAEN
jgi:hypothetical protein